MRIMRIRLVSISFLYEETRMSLRSNLAWHMNNVFNCVVWKHQDINYKRKQCNESALIS